ncbi:MAG: hypothetical protein PHU21_01280 [Elusimicrobia bacterium]|nr:hypothetical protein [Elusimicrobiota bacterium]
MTGTVLAKALALWYSPAFQELLRPVRTLSAISAMFWMLARLAALFMAGLKTLLPEELGVLLAIVWNIVLSVAYAAMMFYTALQGNWHPSLPAREACGFVFMYVMLGVTFTDRATGRLQPVARPGFFIGISAYLFLALAPSVARLPVFAESHRVLELFAAGGWGNVMTALTAALMLWSLLAWTVSEVAYSLSPLLFRLKLIKAPLIRFRDLPADGEDGAPARRIGAVPSMRRSVLMLALLAAGAGAALRWWPQLRAGARAAAPAIQSRAQSPQAAEAAARLKRVLPAVSFTAVRSLPRQGPVAELARPAFRKLLAAPAQADRWLAAAALDRVDPSFRISPQELFRSTAAASWDCAWQGRAFQVLMQPLPGDEPAKTRTYWVLDERGLHFTGVGPGELSEVAGSSACAVAAFGSADGALLLAFTEAPAEPGAAPRLWLTAYSPTRREVLAAARLGENASGDFALAEAAGGVVWADAPASTAAAACRGDCGEVLGGRALSSAVEPLVEYRRSAAAGGAIRTAASLEQTFAHSGLDRHFASLAAFARAFRFDPEAGFLNRWYRRARLVDGRDCVSVALDPSWPGWEAKDAWTCAQ